MSVGGPTLTINTFETIPPVGWPAQDIAHGIGTKSTRLVGWMTGPSTPLYASISADAIYTLLGESWSGGHRVEDGIPGYYSIVGDAVFRVRVQADIIFDLGTVRAFAKLDVETTWVTPGVMQQYIAGELDFSAESPTVGVEYMNYATGLDLPAAFPDPCPDFIFSRSGVSVPYSSLNSAGSVKVERLARGLFGFRFGGAYGPMVSQGFRTRIA